MCGYSVEWLLGECVDALLAGWGVAVGAGDGEGEFAVLLDGGFVFHFRLLNNFLGSRALLNVSFILKVSKETFLGNGTKVSLVT